MKYIQLLICFIIFPAALFAQTNYTPGYIVNIKGDTVRGFINYREWTVNPRQILFKRNQGDAKASQFDRLSTKGFGVNGLEYYERHVVSVSMDTVDVSTIKGTQNERPITDTVFLRILTRGKYFTLYRFTDDIKPRFYLSATAQNSKPEELSYHAIADSTRQNEFKYIKRFRNQLLYAAQSVHVPGSVEQMIERAEYRQGDLQRTVSKINGGADSRYVSQSESGSRWFAGIGGSYYSLAYNGHTALSDASPKSGFTPTIDAGVDLFPFRGVQQFYLRIEAGLSYYQFSYNQPDPYTTASNATLTLNVKQLNATLTPQAVFNILNGQKLKLFIDAGLGLNFSSYNQYQEVITYKDIAPYTKAGYPEFDTFWVTIPLKAGIAINKKLEVYVAYTPSKGISDQSDENSQGNIKLYGAGINYYFGKR